VILKDISILFTDFPDYHRSSYFSDFSIISHIAKWYFKISYFHRKISYLIYDIYHISFRYRNINMIQMSKIRYIVNIDFYLWLVYDSKIYFKMSTKYQKLCFAKSWITFIDLPISVKVKKFFKTDDAKTKLMSG